MTDVPTGWEAEKRTHFDEIVVNYHRARPDYPGELFQDIYAYLGKEAGKQALEIGAGTGKATAPILDAGYEVTAVELGRNMADFLAERFRGYRNFNVIVAPFEEVPLEAESYDLIYAASSIHWMDAEVVCPQILRALKECGVLALLRYDRVPAQSEVLYEEIRAVYEKHYYTYYTATRRPVKKSHEDYLKPSEILYSYGFEDLSCYGFRDVAMKFYDVPLEFSGEEYIAFLETMADHRGLPEENRAALYQGIREAITSHGGHHREDHVFRLYIGRK